MTNKRKKCIMSNSGFTLVELVVVLLLMSILLSITVFGGLAWQDWMKFRHENSVAEEVFFAAQNQLMEWDAGGSLEELAVRPMQTNKAYDSTEVLAYSDGTSVYEQTLLSMTDKDGAAYSWDTIWKHSEETAEALGIGTNTNRNMPLTILSIKAESQKEDYKKYLNYKNTGSRDGLSRGTILLFELITPYISDQSVLNGTILLEFSPETGQVFSALFSDRAESFGYGSGNWTDVSDRQLAAREDLMLGYYGVDQLTEKIRGKNVDVADLRLEIRTGETLSLVLHRNTGVFQEGSSIRFNIYDGDENNSKELAMTIDMDYDDLKGNSNLSEAREYPVPATVNFSRGLYNGREIEDMRFLAWKDANDIHVVLDAADVQAQTSIYKRAKEDASSTAAERFRNTFSFYRFGLADAVHYIYADASLDGSVPVNSLPGDSSAGLDSHINLYTDGGVCGECTTFDSYTEETAEGTDETERKVFRMTNGRHLYNVRYETECKADGALPNKFVLADNIDWYEFTGKYDSDAEVYFLSSYEMHQDNTNPVVAGIDYPGNLKATGGSGKVSDIVTDGRDMPFPSFRCLGKGDTFTQDVPYGAEGTSYVISNLTISFAANVVYGIYDDVLDTTAGAIKDTDGKIKDAEGTEYYTVDPALKNRCMNGDFSGLLGLVCTENASDNAKARELNLKKDSSRSHLARGGALPLGLFCENLGTISNVTLDHHIVRGMEEGLDVSEEQGNALVYTCMVGGFAGNNIGNIDRLTLLSSPLKEGEIANETHINGRADVGGIIGRQSFVLSGAPSDVVIQNMKNYGRVSGMENVGGIVGRAYVNYIGDTVNPHKVSYYDYETPLAEKDVVRATCYHDGYYITDTGLSMTGASVGRATTVTIKGCSNRGVVSGDDLLFKKDESGTAVNRIDIQVMVEKEPDVLSYTSRAVAVRCSFIGGIAGITMDGLMYDYRSLYYKPSAAKSDTSAYVLRNYTGFSNGEFSNVTVEECDSYIVYTDDEIQAFSETNNPAMQHDCYVGGLVGYGRLTAFKGCDIEPSADVLGEDGVPKAFVLGQSFVGGMVGCSDMVRYDLRTGQTASNGQKAYKAVNYNNVIGRRFVGGIAGGFGVGDAMQGSLTFRDPAANEASRVSQIYGTDQNCRVADSLKNTGIVLGLKATTYFEFDDTKANMNGAVGGIGGGTRFALQNSDNIQTEAVKNYMVRMISNDEVTSIGDITVDSLQQIIQDSKYGGNAVGGIVGYTYGLGYVNSVDSAGSAESLVDAVVYGQECVGGALGSNSVKNESGGEVYNCKPVKAESSSGLFVLGEDSVGGLCGNLMYTFRLSDKGSTTIDAPYTVIGRYAVGGIVGRAHNASNNNEKLSFKKIASNMPERISVQGIAYVGGVIGLNEGTSTENNGTIRNMDISGKFFTGGFFGASIRNSSPSFVYLTNSATKTPALKADDYSVNVRGMIFTGGMIGLYTVGSYKDITTSSGFPIKLIDDNLVVVSQNKKSYVDAATAFTKIATADIENDTSVNTRFKSYTIEKPIEFDKSYSHLKVNVESELFAGGLFGYVPEGLKVHVKGFVNESNIRTTGSVTGVNESYDNTTKYSYLGSVIGRVPKNMSLTDCKNTVAGNTESSYYYADEATYLGGLAEVNAGQIFGSVIQQAPTDDEPGEDERYKSDTSLIVYCQNSTDYDYPDKTGVGAFVGVNGTKHTDGTESGVISYCSNRATVRAKSAAGIAAALGGKSKIQYSENRGDISATDSNNGSVAGIAGKTIGGISADTESGELKNNIVVLNCLNLGEINKQVGGVKAKYSAGIVYDTAGCGNVTLCRNYGPGAEYGITATGAETVTKNLEASGLNESTGTKKPIAPMDKGNLVRNFYLYGEEAEAQEQAATGSSTGQFYSIDFNAMGYTKQAKDHNNNAYFARYNWYFEAQVNEACTNSYSYLYTQYDWIWKKVYYATYGGPPKNSQEPDIALEKTHTIVGYCVIAYYMINGDDATRDGFYPFLKTTIETGVFPGKTESEMIYTDTPVAEPSSAATYTPPYNEGDDYRTIDYSYFADKPDAGAKYIDKYGWDLNSGPKNKIGPLLNWGGTIPEETIQNYPSLVKVYNDFSQNMDAMHNYLKYTFAAYMFQYGIYSDEMFDDFYQYLDNIVTTGQLPNVQAGAGTSGDYSGQGGSGSGSSKAHWPLQLYVRTSGADDQISDILYVDGSVKEIAGMQGFDTDLKAYPTTLAGRVTQYLTSTFDKAYLLVADDEDGYKDSDFVSE